MSLSKSKIEELEAVLNDVTSGMADIHGKKMFGCHALWVKDNVFALVWKYGRIGFKLPNEKSYEKLMSMEGAEPWKAGPMKMAHWVLVPEPMHTKKAALTKWANLAYAECMSLPPKKAVKKKPVRK